MADRMSAEIWIGGRLRRSLLEQLPVSDLCLDWDDNRLQSVSEANLLAARDEDGLLHFADAEAAWGEFEELENWLRNHKIPFQRHSEGKYEYSPRLVAFRPDLKGKRNQDIDLLATQSGNPVVEMVSIEKIIDQMAGLAADRKQPAVRHLQRWEKLFAKLVKVLPPHLPPLPPLEIVGG